MEVNQDLIEAVRRGDLQRTTRLMHSIGLSNWGRFTLLRIASEENHTAMVKLLLSKGCSYRVSGSMPSPLHLAAQNGNLDIIKLLLNMGAHIDDGDWAGDTPLAVAVDQGCLPAVKLLLKRGADVNRGNRSGQTPLNFTASIKKSKGAFSYSCGEEEVEDPVKLEIAQLLLSKGANVDSLGNGETTLMTSLRRKFYSLASLLLRYNANVNLARTGAATPLHITAKDGNIEITAQLLAKGAYVDAKTENEETALHLAVTENHEEIVELLLGKNVVLGKEIYSVHSDLSHLKRKNNITTTLFCEGDMVNAENKHGNTALHLAVLYNNEKIVEFLLKRGALVNCTGEYGHTPLHQVANVIRYMCPPTREEKVITAMLLSNGANVNAKSNSRWGDTALHLAVYSRQGEVAKLMLEAGAEVNAKDAKGKTPLHEAATPETVDILLSFGASVNATCNNGKTPLDDLASQGHTMPTATAIASLLDYGADKVQSLLWNGRYYRPFRDVLEQHQIKMEVAGLSQMEANIRPEESHPDDYHSKCKLELRILKSQFIENSNVTYYDVLSKPTKMMSKYMKNENVLESKSEDLKGKFPIYGGMVQCRFQQGWARMKLFEAAGESFRRLIDLPDLCTEKILGFLCDEDLKQLTEV